MTITRLPANIKLVFSTLLFASAMAVNTFAVHDVSSSTPLILPIGEVLGGVGPENNFKSNPLGHYYSILNNVSENTYSSGHGNTLGNTAIVNDNTYWDGEGLTYTHLPPPEAGGGGSLWLPAQSEWNSYDINVTTAGNYTVLYRFSSGWGPDKPVKMQIMMDDQSSGPFTIKPDSAEFWSNTYYLVGGWWGHSMVNGTCATKFNLAAGHHTMKVSIESFPEKPTEHGWVWIHYFKVAYAGVAGEPICSITAPANNASVTPGTAVTISASVAPGAAAVTKVEFYNGTTLLGTATSAPYQYVWNAIPKGDYSLTAKVTDAAAKTATSAPVTITAGNNVILNRSGWTATASAGGGEAPKAIDADQTSRWTTQAFQGNGQWFQIDMNSVNSFNRIILKSTGSDFPVSYDVVVSVDGSTWSAPVASGSGASDSTSIAIPSQNSRYVRILQKGSSSSHWWSIADLQIISGDAAVGVRRPDAGLRYQPFMATGADKIFTINGRSITTRSATHLKPGIYLTSRNKISRGHLTMIR